MCVYVCLKLNVLVLVTFQIFWQDCSIIKSISLGGFYFTCLHFLCFFYRMKYERKGLFALGSAITPLLFLSFHTPPTPSGSSWPLIIAIKHKQPGFSGQLCAAWVRGGRVVVSSMRSQLFSKWANHGTISFYCKDKLTAGLCWFCLLNTIRNTVYKSRESNWSFMDNFLANLVVMYFKSIDLWYVKKMKALWSNNLGFKPYLYCKDIPKCSKPEKVSLSHWL